jgi:putative oxidoreductase
MTGGLKNGVLPLVARLLLIAEFAIAVNGKITGWQGQEAYMAAHGMKMIGPLLALALAIELGGSICILLGIQARWAAAILGVYLGIVSVTLHNFWAMSGTAAGSNQTQFFKNLGIMGGLLLLALHGPGTVALQRDVADSQP